MRAKRVVSPDGRVLYRRRVRSREAASGSAIQAAREAMGHVHEEDAASGKAAFNVALSSFKKTKGDEGDQAGAYEWGTSAIPSFPGMREINKSIRKQEREQDAKCRSCKELRAGLKISRMRETKLTQAVEALAARLTMAMIKKGRTW